MIILFSRFGFGDIVSKVLIAYIFKFTFLDIFSAIKSLFHKGMRGSCDFNYFCDSTRPCTLAHALHAMTPCDVKRGLKFRILFENKLCNLFWVLNALVESLFCILLCTNVCVCVFLWMSIKNKQNKRKKVIEVASHARTSITLIIGWSSSELHKKDSLL